MTIHVVVVDGVHLELARSTRMPMLVKSTADPRVDRVVVVALGAGGGILVGGQLLESIGTVPWPATLGRPTGRETPLVLEASYTAQAHAPGHSIELVWLADDREYGALKKEVSGFPGVRQTSPTTVPSTRATRVAAASPARTSNARTVTTSKSSPKPPTTSSSSRSGIGWVIFVIVILAAVAVVGFLIKFIDGLVDEALPTSTNLDALSSLVMSSTEGSCISARWTLPATGEMTVATKPSKVGCDASAAAVKVVSHGAKGSSTTCPDPGWAWTSTSTLVCVQVLYHVGDCFPGTSTGQIYDNVIACSSTPTKKFSRILRVAAWSPGHSAECAAGDLRYELGEGQSDSSTLCVTPIMK